MGNPRRVYIYPSQQQYDVMPTSPFLPSDSADDLYSPQSDSFTGLGAGLLGMLLATMQRGQHQSEADSGAVQNDVPTVNSDSHSGPQGGLLGRLTAPQAGPPPYRPIAGSSEQTPSAPRDPNFRRLSGAPVISRRQNGNAPFNPIDDRSGPQYSSIGPDASPDFLGSSGERAPPEWFAASPTMNAAQRASPDGGISLPPMTPVPLPSIYMQANPRSRNAVSKMSRTAASIGRRGGDDENVCDKRQREEFARCQARARAGEYADPDWLPACLNRATIRWDLCNRNGYRIPRFEPSEWGLDPDEEVWINESR
jgi:hypothetical protein